MYTPGNEITIKSLNLPQKRGFKRCTPVVRQKGLAQLRLQYGIFPAA